MSTIEGQGEWARRGQRLRAAWVVEPPPDGRSRPS